MAKKASVVEGDLNSGLERLSRREQCDLIEGLRFHDQNIKGNVLIVTSSTEFYSVRQEDILEDPDSEAYPERVWIKKGSTVWHCRATPFRNTTSSIAAADVLNKEANVLDDEINLTGLRGEPPALSLPTATLSQNLDELADLESLRGGTSVPAKPIPKLSQKEKEQCVLDNYHKEPKDLKTDFRNLFGPGFNKSHQSPLYQNWPECLCPQPSWNAYKEKVQKVNTLADFIRVFGGE